MLTWYIYMRSIRNWSCKWHTIPESTMKILQKKDRKLRLRFKWINFIRINKIYDENEWQKCKKKKRESNLKYHLSRILEMCWKDSRFSCETRHNSSKCYRCGKKEKLWSCEIRPNWFLNNWFENRTLFDETNIETAKYF